MRIAPALAVSACLAALAACDGGVVVPEVNGTSASGSSSSGTGGGPAGCAPSETTCGGACVDLDHDPDDCGACGHSCFGGACVGGACQPFEIVSGHPFRIVVGADHLYFSDKVPKMPPTRIERVALAGGAPEVLAETPMGFSTIAIDAENVYFSAGPGACIERVPLAGGATTTITSDPALCDTAMAADFALDGDRLLVSTFVSGYTRALIGVPKAGGSIETLLSAKSADASPVAQIDGTIYWPIYMDDTDGAILALPPGGGPPASIPVAPAQPEVLFADAGGLLFWSHDGRWLRVPFAGGALVEVASGVKVWRAMADEAFVYWTDHSAGTVSRLPRNGGPVVVLASDQDAPGDVAVDATSVYWVNDGEVSDKSAIMRLAKPLP